MQRLTNYQFYVVFIYIFLVGISSVTVAQDLIPIEEKEKTQILKELNAKWDGDLSAIVTWDVHYRRCHVAYENLKKFVPEDIIRLVNAVPKDKSTSIFDYFFDSLVDLNSYEKLEGSTQTPQQMTIFRNHFRFTDKQRWEESTRSGGFLSGGRPIRDHVRVVYADDEKYVTHTELNRDAKIGNVANFHELFAYLMDFLPQPLERVDWKDPQILRNLQIFRSAADSAIIFIHERGKVYEINQSQGTLLNQTATRQGTVITQIYLFDFFTPEKNLWLPRTVLTVDYIPRAVLESGYQGTDFMPYTVHINEIDEVKINEPLTESDFYVSVPKGCVVSDYRLDKKNPRLSQADENIEDVVSWMDAQWEPHPVTVTSRKNRIGLLQVSGNVLPEISITPPSIQSDFGEGKPIEETKTLTITRNVRANKIPSLPLPLLESLPSSVQIVEIKETTVPTSIADCSEGAGSQARLGHVHTS